MQESIYDIECPDGDGFKDHPSCEHWKFDSEFGEYYCDKYPDIRAVADPDEFVTMPWE
jgi:hypothetical protein